MMQVTIDGRRLSVPAGTTVLDAARAAGIEVPTLCHHPSVAPFGACRLCVVEIRLSPTDVPRIAPSCLERVFPAMEIRTASPDVRLIRRCILELLLAVSPGSSLLRRLAADQGVDLGGFSAEGEAHGCILCGLCTRVCAAGGFHAIAQHGRGPQAQVAGPLGSPPPDCTGCAVCAHVCPTGHIQLTQADGGGARTIWGRTFEVARCAGCGVPTITRAQIEHASARLNRPAETFSRCPACNGRATADTAARVIGSVASARQGVATDAAGPAPVAGVWPGASR